MTGRANSKEQGTTMAKKLHMTSLRCAVAAFGLAALMALAPTPAPAQPVAAAPPAPDAVDAIRARGHVLCGVAPSAPGFAMQAARGVWQGLDVDFCRGMASAILGDAAKVRFVPIPAAERFARLRQGEVDLLARNTTWTLEREVGEGVVFAAITYFDGQGFLVRRDRGVTRVQQLEGATICVEAGTTSEQHLVDHMARARLRINLLRATSGDAARAAFLAQQCDALTGDSAGLAGFMAQQGSRAPRFAVLFEVISKEPLGPVLRQQDLRLARIARWTHFVMLTAEELGLDSSVVQQLRTGPAEHLASASQDVQRLFGRQGRSGELLGLDADWGARVITQVGNYREIWDRNIGPLGVERGMNLLWNQGGLQFPPPVR